VLRFVRRSAVVAAVLLTSLVAAGPAMAASNTPSPSPSGYACLQQEEGYAATGVCQLLVTKAVSVCRQGVPWLDYAVEPQGTPNTTTTLVWGDPSGPHSVTMANLPLTGSVLWPGALLDSKGNPIDWPGWRLVNGQWVQGDEFDWVRPAVAVTFHVNPQATVTVSYPPEQAPCANPPTAEVLAEGDGSSAALAATGSSDAEPLMLIGVGVLVLGGVLLTVRALLKSRDAQR
jgi:hypothetical protein